MGSTDFTYVNPDQIAELVYNDVKFIKEFAEASEKSFSEFKSHYGRYLLERDEERFRKAGHKIKPIAQMLNIEVIIEEYEHAKTLLWENKNQEELEQSAEKINEICDTIIQELRAIRNED